MFRGFTDEERPWADVNLKNHRIPAFITSVQQTLPVDFEERNMFKSSAQLLCWDVCIEVLGVWWWCNPGHLWWHNSHEHQWELHDQCLSCRSCHSWQTASWHMGQLGHLGRHFPKESLPPWCDLQFHAKNFIKSSPRITPKKNREPSKSHGDIYELSQSNELIIGRFAFRLGTTNCSVLLWAARAGTGSVGS